ALPILMSFRRLFSILSRMRILKHCHFKLFRVSFNALFCWLFFLRKKIEMRPKGFDGIIKNLIDTGVGVG
ncbi:MAG TPA: hypothetical protein DDY51_11980, partial [Erwinia persicina]|nr:hypothetical protein [Erwinia persicina]